MVSTIHVDLLSSIRVIYGINGLRNIDGIEVGNWVEDGTLVEYVIYSEVSILEDGLRVGFLKMVSF